MPCLKWAGSIEEICKLMRYPLRFFLFFFLIIRVFAWGQEDGFDSKKYSRIIDSFDRTFDRYPDSCFTIGEYVLKKATLTNDTQLIVKSLILISNSHIVKSKYDEGIRSLLAAKKLLNRFDDPVLSYKVFKNLSVLFYQNDRNIEALENIREALRVAKKNGNDTLLAKAYLFTANILSRKSIAQYDTALILLRQSEYLHEKLKLKDKGLLYYYYGTAYHAKNEYDQSIKYFSIAIDEYKRIGDTTSVVAASKEIGDIYYFLNKNEQALRYYTQAFELQQKMTFQNNESIATLACDIGYMYAVLGDMEKFRYYEKESNKYAELSIGWFAKNYCAQWFSDIHERKGNYKEALRYLQQYITSKDSMLQKESIDKLAKAEADLNAQFKVELTKKEEEKKRIILEQAEHQQRLLRNIFISGLVISLVLLYFVFKNYRDKKQANVTLQQQKDKIELQKKIVDYQNKELTDSINYAQTIQKSILPEMSDIQNAFPDSFIFFKPKDVVSGDFYWFKQKSNRRYIAAVDCTGHGVPGAFMSMIANTLLNEIIDNKGIVHPADVLNELKKEIMRSLKQTGADGENKDGLDIALCMLEGNTLEYAGAHNPLWLFLEGNLIEIKGDNQPVGVAYKNDKEFTNHVLDVTKTDAFYIFTDGFADQFGGIDGKKFKYSRLKQMITDLCKLPVNEQHKKLASIFDEWKRDLEQVDDVLVIGIKM